MKNKQLNIERGRSLKKEKELGVMKERIERSLNNTETREKVTKDFSYTFEQLGLSLDEAKKLCNRIFELLLGSNPLLDIEQEILRVFENIKLDNGNKEQNLIEILHEKLIDRAKIIAAQVSPYLKNTGDKVIDYGA